MLAIPLVSACATTVSGVAVPGAQLSAPASLPFTPTISERTNDRNNGSSFEPCTAYSAAELQVLGIASESATDAAISDSPNYRGCHWNSTLGHDSTYSQTVGNGTTLEGYKQKNSDRTWQVDRVINGRMVALTVDPPSRGCAAVFMSQHGTVVTLAMLAGDREPEPDFATECDAALRFTELATRKAPR